MALWLEGGGSLEERNTLWQVYYTHQSFSFVFKEIRDFWL